MIILGIESSCDETAVAIVKDKKEVLSSIVASQIDVHKEFGGVVPEVASRIHVENISYCIEQALAQANVTMDMVDAIAVTKGPGLIGCLHVGVQAAKTLAFAYHKPLVPVHHLAAHIYANELVVDMKYPVLALVVSGGNTELVYMKNETTKFSVSSAILVISNRIKHWALIIFPLCFFFISCNGSKKQSAGQEVNEVKLQTEDILFPVSEVLNLKSYYLSSYFHNDSLSLIYGYNYKSHALDCMDLKRHQISQILLSSQGKSAVMRSVAGLFIQTPDSIWIYDDTQRILLINGDGKLLKTVDLRPELKDNEQILINTNHAISTARLFYDGGRHSLLYGIKDFSTSPVTFKVRETFLNSMTPSVDYLLQPSVAVTNVSGRDYGNMSDLNITFTAEKLLYNYPVESHVYVMDRKSGEQKVFEADSRFTKNVVEKCESGNYEQWNGIILRILISMILCIFRKRECMPVYILEE